MTPELNEMVLIFVETSLAGLSTGAIYALVALGFVIIYKSTKTINFAIGDFMMVSAYMFLALFSDLGLPPVVSIILAVSFGGVIGGVSERLLIRPMMGESQISIAILTIGLASILVGIVNILWTSDPQVIPSYLPTKPIFIGDMYLSPKITFSAAIALVVMAGSLMYYRFSRSGVALRATASDQDAAYSMGINVPLVFSLSWIVGGMAMALSGILVASSGGLDPNMGSIALTILVIVIFGGLDSILGALVGGLLIGWVETLAAAYLGGEYRILATFSILALILIVRPYGLFGTHEIERL